MSPKIYLKGKGKVNKRQNHGEIQEEATPT